LRLDQWDLRWYPELLVPVDGFASFFHDNNVSLELSLFVDRLHESISLGHSDKLNLLVHWRDVLRLKESKFKLIKLWV
jgi:hypothetical protein